MANIVGPGGIQEETTQPLPSLFGASEYEYVTVQNPLSDDFAARVAQERPVDLPFNIRQDGSGKTQAITQTEQDARQIYGLSLKNKEHPSKKSIINTTVIKAGKTLNLRGNDAQVVVKQLVDEMMQREGETLFMANPVYRKKYEDRIIIARGSMQDIMDNNMRTPQQQINDALVASNKDTYEEFPDLNRPTVSELEETGANTGTDTSAPAKRGRGRPTQTQQTN